jgi:hypothetical protein
MSNKSILYKHFKNAESFTLTEAVNLVGKFYYCNERFHVGNILSRMVKGGVLIRLKKGVFKFIIF